MSCIVYQVDKKTGVKYAYKSESYWDKEKQQPRSKRTYIGKVDPETGEIIPKEKRGSHSDSKKNDVTEELTKLYKELLKNKLNIFNIYGILISGGIPYVERCAKTFYWPYDA